MTGRKKLSEIRAELEAALGSAPIGEGDVVEALRRFVAANPPQGTEPKKSSSPKRKPKPVPDEGRDRQ
jgi:hypothetical protein